jgi:hypothetical protein
MALPPNLLRQTKPYNRVVKQSILPPKPGWQAKPRATSCNKQCGNASYNGLGCGHPAARQPAARNPGAKI